MKSFKKAITPATVILLLLLNTSFVQAQMQAARKVINDFDTTVTFKVPRSVIWNKFKDPAKWHEVSDGFIVSTEINQVAEKTYRSIVFADGTKRKDLFTQIEPVNRMMVATIVEPLPKGITDNYFMISVIADSEHSCRFLFAFKADGDAREKQELVKQMKNECYAYLRGLNKLVSSGSGM
jgi:hypothetical protein